MAVVQGTTAIMSRVLNNNSDNNGKLKFIYFSANSENNGINNLSDYPLNLLFDINYDKFIPKNKFGKILNFIINRYLKI